MLLRAQNSHGPPLGLPTFGRSWHFGGTSGFSTGPACIHSAMGGRKTDRIAVCPPTRRSFSLNHRRHKVCSLTLLDLTGCPPVFFVNIEQTYRAASRSLPELYLSTLSGFNFFSCVLLSVLHVLRADIDLSCMPTLLVTRSPRTVDTVGDVALLYCIVELFIFSSCLFLFFPCSVLS